MPQRAILTVFIFTSVVTISKERGSIIAMHYMSYYSFVKEQTSVNLITKVHHMVRINNLYYRNNYNIFVHFGTLFVCYFCVNCTTICSSFVSSVNILKE